MTTPHQPAVKAVSSGKFLTATKPRAAKALVDSTANLPANPARVSTPSAGAQDGWRESHLGRLLGESVRRFDARVLTLMAHDIDVPLALSNLAAHGQVSAAHIHITRHVGLQGSRLTDLAEAAGMSKQAMGDLVTQCEAWGIVQRQRDPADARARLVCFTEAGLQWLAAFEAAVTQAEAEFRQEVGDDVARVVAFGLEGYSRSYA
jgi:DNA-binding MarR family transcriptional regulator